MSESVKFSSQQKSGIDCYDYVEYFLRAYCDWICCCANADYKDECDLWTFGKQLGTSCVADSLIPEIRKQWPLILSLQEQCIIMRMPHKGQSDLAVFFVSTRKMMDWHLNAVKYILTIYAVHEEKQCEMRHWRINKEAADKKLCISSQLGKVHGCPLFALVASDSFAGYV